MARGVFVCIGIVCACVLTFTIIKETSDAPECPHITSPPTTCQQCAECPRCIQYLPVECPRCIECSPVKCPAPPPVTKKHNNLDETLIPLVVPSANPVNLPHPLFNSLTLTTINTAKGAGIVAVPGGENLYTDGSRAINRLADLICSACLLAPDTTGIVIDVGALLGDFSIRTALAGCRTVAFEPQSRYAQLVRGAAAISGLSSLVTVVVAAVGENNTVLYYSPGTHPGNAMFTAEKMGNDPLAVAIPSYRIDSVFDEETDILLLKIDVEGYDASAILGAEKLIKAHKVHHLIFEFTAFWNDKGRGRWLEILQWLTALQPAPRLYTMARQETSCYGPLGTATAALTEFVESHKNRGLQTDVYAVFDASFDPRCSGPWRSELYA